MMAVNFVQHLRAIFDKMNPDESLSSAEISLYMALFQEWNIKRFKNPIKIYRPVVLQRSKIAEGTYYKALRTLQSSGYIIMHKPSKKFALLSVTILMLDGTNNNIDTDPDLVPPNNKFDAGGASNSGCSLNKTSLNSKCVNHTPTNSSKIIDEQKGNKNNSPRNSKLIPPSPPSIDEIEIYFQSKEFPNARTEAEKFFAFNNAKNWMITYKVPIMVWKSIADKWMLNEKKENEHSIPEYTTETLFELYCKNGNKILPKITEKHYQALQLKLSTEIWSRAWDLRKSLLEGTDKHEELELLKVYCENNIHHSLAIQDEPNRLKLAQKIAVLIYFNKKKEKLSK